MGLFSSKPVQPVSMFGAPAPVPSTRPGIVTIVLMIVGSLILLLLGMSFYNYIRKSQGKDAISIFPTSESSGDKAPTSIDGKTKTVIPSGDLPASTSSDTGLQFWMFISDWDYKFGQQKSIVERVSPTNAAIKNPAISLSATENTLQVKVSIFPAGPQAGAGEPGADTTGDTFTCSVENVPLQSWFSVSTTVFQRNLDIYINGRLVKSCVLPGVPKPAAGDIVLNNNGGFSGSICNVHSYGSMLTPDDALAFFMAGTTCSPPVASKVDKDSIFITLFGYTFRFSTLDKMGKELSGYTF